MQSKVAEARLMLLASIFMLRQKSGSKDPENFQDFLRKHLSNADADESPALSAIPTSIGITLALLQELSKLGKGPIMLKTLQHVLFTLKRVEPGAFS